MTILEACQAAAPMVITETCEIADILANKVATVVPVEPAKIATAMAELLNNPELRQQYKCGAQELMETTFSIQAVGQLLETIYTNAIKAK
jgi:glycosyltransferase involved in cell wall biosynthesis